MNEIKVNIPLADPKLIQVMEGHGSVSHPSKLKWAMRWFLAKHATYSRRIKYEFKHFLKRG
jgi:hypothetical protein